MLEMWVIKKPAAEVMGWWWLLLQFLPAGIVFLADLQGTGYKLPWQQLPPLQIINTAHRHRTRQDQFT